MDLTHQDFWVDTAPDSGATSGDLRLDFQCVRDVRRFLGEDSMTLRKLILAGTMLLWPLMLHAQEVALTGTVTDSTGAVLPGVSVTATHTDSGNTFAGVTDASGTYALNALRTGSYKLRVELAGFSTIMRDNLDLQVGQRAVLNFSMTLSSLQESITVAAAAPLVDFTQSRVAGVIDQRQMQDLPLNGRNWMELTLLSPGSRSNPTGVTESPISGNPSAGSFQLNVDGQQVSNTMACARWGQPKFSRDAIEQFEMVTSRWDATQGRSTQVQVNAVTKAGTNRYQGTAAGYFRSARFNSKDFILNRVTPFSDQQASATFGGPFVKDKFHFFGYYDGERKPDSYAYTSPYPRFNAVLTDVRMVLRDHKWGGRSDYQFSSNTRLMVRANGWLLDQPGASNTGGSLIHPSRSTTSTRESEGGMASLTQVLSSRSVNEIKGGFTQVSSKDFSIVESPQISLRGYTIGNVSFQPLYLTARSYQIRDDFSTHVSDHSLRYGGEVLRNQNIIYWPSNKFGILTANTGNPPANLEDLFPVWNDPRSWNLDGLSSVAFSWTQSVPAPGTDYEIIHPNHNIAAWFQDDWRALNRLTLNLGVRWDLLLGALGEEIDFPPFRTTRGHEWRDVSPRLGFAYELSPKTALRGGWGIYYQGVTDQPTHHSLIDKVTVGVTVFNDGRTDFASNPYKLGRGVKPSYEQALAMAGTRSINGTLLSPSVETPYTYQTTIGVQQQIGKDMSFKTDFVLAQDRAGLTARNVNLVYNTANGAPYPASDATKRVYPGWSTTSMRFSQGKSDYRALETAFTKRMSHNWQLYITYTLAGTWNYDVLPINDGCQYPYTAPGVCNVPITLAPDLFENQLYLSGSQRHRAVVNGIWEAPFGMQVSGLLFYSDGGRSTTTSGLDLYGVGGNGTPRLRADRSLIPRNNFNNDDTVRTDLRVTRHFKLSPRVGLDIFGEAFNALNDSTYQYTLNESNANFGRISTANSPRSVQLGLRIAY